jgi:hypothetical protein
MLNPPAVHYNDRPRRSSRRSAGLSSLFSLKMPQCSIYKDFECDNNRCMIPAAGTSKPS